MMYIATAALRFWSGQSTRPDLRTNFAPLQAPPCRLECTSWNRYYLGMVDTLISLATV